MAVDIDLNIYKDSAETKHLGCVHLYFGQALRTTYWSGWDWVEQNGMKVDPPWTLDDKNNKRGKIIQRETLLKWIHEGCLSPDLWGKDTSGIFLNEYPKNAVFRLSFLDWS